jgi:hypothetical protein
MAMVGTADVQITLQNGLENIRMNIFHGIIKRNLSEHENNDLEVYKFHQIYLQDV